MHPDPDEPADDAASFDRVREVGSSLEDADFERVAPPPGLWAAIEARLGEQESPTAPEPLAEPEVLAAPEVSTEDADDADDPGPQTRRFAAIAPDHAVSDDALQRLDERRRPRTVLVGIAAAIVLVVAGAVGLGLALRDTTTTEVVASTTLDTLEGGASARAELIRSGDGDRLKVIAQNMEPAPPGTHYELWLVDPEVTDPRSLGPMEGSTEVVVPSTIDPDEFPVVDISLQPDGSHEHSGHSLLRGTLQ
jgi:Anti-sigma-K factor rskA